MVKKKNQNTTLGKPRITPDITSMPAVLQQSSSKNHWSHSTTGTWTYHLVGGGGHRKVEGRKLRAGSKTPVHSTGIPLPVLKHL